MDIDANRRSVRQLFETSDQYRVPPYQRPYAWGSTQIDQFWEDIAESDNEGHFMGPLVIYAKDEGEREVIDGQQRLATVQILLALIRDKYLEMGQDENAAATHSLVFSSYFAQGDRRFSFRAGHRNWPVLRDYILQSPENKERRLIGDKKDEQKLKEVDWAQNKALVDAYTRLRSNLDEYVDNSAADGVASLQALEEKLIRRVDFVSIIVQGLADAFLLFETLNDRGLGLSAADLLKSHILAKLDEKHDDEVVLHEAANQWDDLVEQLGGGDITKFLRHYLLMSHKKVRKSDIYEYFQDDVRSVGPQKLLNDLQVMGEKYAQLLDPDLVDNDEVRRVLEYLGGINVRSHNIALLPARRWLDENDFNRVAKFAEVLSFRWIVSGLNAQDLEAIYQEAASVLHKSGGDQLDEAIKLLTEQLPADDQFRSQFRRERMGVKYVARYMMKKIENGLREMSELELRIKPPQKVHIEHIMPTTSTDFWDERVQPHEDYEDAVSRWGNLTLLHESPNKSIRNGPWDKKVSHYADSEIILTNSLTAKDDWNSMDVDVRQQWMALAASKVWSLKATEGGRLNIPPTGRSWKIRRLTGSKYLIPTIQFPVSHRCPARSDAPWVRVEPRSDTALSSISRRHVSLRATPRIQRTVFWWSRWSRKAVRIVRSDMPGKNAYDILTDGSKFGFEKRNEVSTYSEALELQRDTSIEAEDLWPEELVAEFVNELGEDHVLSEKSKIPGTDRWHYGFSKQGKEHLPSWLEIHVSEQHTETWIGFLDLLRERMGLGET